MNAQSAARIFRNSEVNKASYVNVANSLFNTDYNSIQREDAKTFLYKKAKAEGCSVNDFFTGYHEMMDAGISEMSVNGYFDC